MRTRRKVRFIVILLITIIAVIATLGVYLGKMQKSFPNLTVDDISVGNMSRDKIVQKLEAEGWKERTTTLLRVNTFCGVTADVDPVLAGAAADCETAAELACEYGKSSNIFSNIRSFIKCIFSKTDINELSEAINNEYIDRIMDWLQNELDEKLKDGSYSIDTANNELVLIKGYSTGLKLDKALLQENIETALRNCKPEIGFYELSEEPVMPDFDALHEQICSQGHDASFSTDGSHTIIPEEDSYSFDVAEASRIWQAAGAGEVIRIPMEIKQAEVTAEYLESMMYRDLLGAMTTKYNNSGENRCSNVRLATSKVDGTVIFPGEEFSFNNVVGARTAEAGFLMAPAYAGYDDIKEELGGGVCQVSSGVYASALYAFLDITAHTCHVYPPNYIQLGTDATVTIPSDGGREIDLKFVNNKAFPIKITGYCQEYVDEESGKPIRTVTIEIWGTLEPDDIMPIEFDNTYADIYDYDRHIEPAYPDREGYRLWFTHDETEFEDDIGKGLRTLTYMRIYNSSGELVDKRILNKLYDFGYGMDTYYYMK